MQHETWVKSLQSIPAVYSQHVENMAIDLLESALLLAKIENPDALPYYTEQVEKAIRQRKKQQWEGVDY